tara:strand:- start:784 stop:1026 length:243 start_codon:yes stop_codon:yes gene_type:complete
MQIKYIVDLSPITDQFVLFDTRDGDGSDINHEVAMGLFNECPSESFFSSTASARIQSLGRHSKELFKGTTEELAHLTAMV